MEECRSGHNGVALKASVSLKTPVGSNPTSSAISGVMVVDLPTEWRIVSRAVLPGYRKIAKTWCMRVYFNGRMSVFQTDSEGSIPFIRSNDQIKTGRTVQTVLCCILLGSKLAFKRTVSTLAKRGLQNDSPYYAGIAQVNYPTHR